MAYMTANYLLCQWLHCPDTTLQRHNLLHVHPLTTANLFNLSCECPYLVFCYQTLATPTNCSPKNLLISLQAQTCTNQEQEKIEIDESPKIMGKQRKDKETRQDIFLMHELLFLWIFKLMACCEACMQRSILHPLDAQSRLKLAYSASHTPDAPDVAFSMESFKVGIDTCASATMSACLATKTCLKTSSSRIWVDAKG